MRIRAKATGHNTSKIMSDSKGRDLLGGLTSVHFGRVLLFFAVSSTPSHAAQNVPSYMVCRASFSQ